jgi:hypothetical protein
MGVKRMQKAPLVIGMAYKKNQTQIQSGSAFDLRLGSYFTTSVAVMLP